VAVGVLRLDVVADDVADDLGDHGSGNDSSADPADLFGLDVDAEAGNLGQAIVEGRLGVPEAGRGAGNAAVAGFNGPTGGAVPLHAGAVVVGLGAFAAHLVEAPALARALVAPLFNVAAGVVVGAALTLVVDEVAVSEERPAVLVEFRQLVKGEVVDQHSGGIDRIVRAAAEVDEVGETRNRFG
jgi:hypothetical protein